MAFFLISTHWLVSPMRQNVQNPQRMLLSTATRSPSLTWWTCDADFHDLAAELVAEDGVRAEVVLAFHDLDIRAADAHRG